MNKARTSCKLLIDNNIKPNCNNMFKLCCGYISNTGESLGLEKYLDIPHLCICNRLSGIVSYRDSYILSSKERWIYHPNIYLYICKLYIAEESIDYMIDYTIRMLNYITVDNLELVLSILNEYETHKSKAWRIFTNIVIRDIPDLRNIDLFLEYEIDEYTINFCVRFLTDIEINKIFGKGYYPSIMLSLLLLKRDTLVTSLNPQSEYLINIRDTKIYKNPRILSWTNTHIQSIHLYGYSDIMRTLSPNINIEIAIQRIITNFSNSLMNQWYDHPLFLETYLDYIILQGYETNDNSVSNVIDFYPEIDIDNTIYKLLRKYTIKKDIISRLYNFEMIRGMSENLAINITKHLCDNIDFYGDIAFYYIGLFINPDYITTNDYIHIDDELLKYIF
jgi:hypothetical protein